MQRQVRLFVTFLCILNDSLKCWIILYTFCIDNCMNKCNSSATRSVPFSATSDAPFCASLYICKYWSSPRKLKFRCNLRCIIRFTLNCMIKRTSNAFIVFLFALSIFDWPDFESICTRKSIFKSVLKCVPYTLSFVISITSFGGAICGFVVEFQADC